MDGVIDGLYDWPLLRVIQHHRQANVEFPLRAGANPNGQHLHFVMDYSAHFLGRQAGQYNLCSNVPGSPQIKGHSSHRQFVGRQQESNRNLTRFWAKPGSPPLPPAVHNTAIAALEIVAREGSIEAFDAIMSKIPDVLFLTSPRPHFLTLSFSPDGIPPLLAESRSVTLFMASIAYYERE